MIAAAQDVPMAPASGLSPLFESAATRQAILVAVRNALASLVIPKLTEEQDVVTGHLLVRLLDYVEEQHRDAQLSLAGRNGLPSDLLDELASLTGVGALQAQDLAGIADALARLTATPGTSDERVDRRAAFLNRLSSHENAALATLDAHEGVAGTYTKGVVDLQDVRTEAISTPPLTEEGLTAAIRRAGLFGPDASAHSIVEIPGGFNKITAAFKIRHDGGEDAVIIRRDSVPNPTGFTCVDEFPTLRAVWEEGSLPVAEPLMAQGDASVLGSPFILVRRMAGSTDISHWKDKPGAGEALARTLAQALAKLHAIDVRRFLPEGEAVRPLEEYVAAEVHRWRSKSLGWRIRPNPALDAGFAWAAANVPHVARAPVLVHGDVGFHNMLMDGGTLTALLDWEFSHIGDPLEDIIYCKPFVSEVCSFEEFLVMYAEAGGVAYDPSVADFYELWPSLRNGSGCDALMRTFLEHPGSDLKFAVAGTQHARRYENAVLAHLGQIADREGGVR
ncbi:Predicted kinase, aminoglycoside phosphotransferase (APT) family [Sphingobium faniae]|nr:Predicted kinase, aminoglycoside phosphotransferase (APT) family [Sphingobium faniae]